MSTTNVKNLIEELSSINESNTVSINVPSIKKKVKFKLFSVSQQKDLLRTAFEGVEGAVRSGVIFNDIILNNSTQDVEFSLIDRVSILLDLRKHSISNKVSISDKEYDLKDLPALSIEDINSSDEIEYNGIKVQLNIPSLKQDRDISEKIVAEISKLNEDVKRKDSVNILLVYEIIKFITSIEINDSVLNFDDISVYERKKIVDNLPIKLNNSIIDFISSYKAVEEKSLTFDDESKVEIDAGFLTSE